MAVRLVGHTRVAVFIDGARVRAVQGIAIDYQTVKGVVHVRVDIETTRPAVPPCRRRTRKARS